MINLQELHNQVMADPTPPYDNRYTITERQYLEYQDDTSCRYYHYLLKLVKRLKPKKVLELGTSQGRSSLFMMLGLPEDGSLITIDIGSFLRSDLAAFANDSRLKIVFGNDLYHSVFSKIENNIELLFIDSEHSFEQIFKEWDIYRPKLVDGAIVVMDDIHLNQGMERFWDSLPYEKIDTGGYLHFSGFGLFVYKQPLDNIMFI